MFLPGKITPEQARRPSTAAGCPIEKISLGISSLQRWTVNDCWDSRGLIMCGLWLLRDSVRNQRFVYLSQSFSPGGHFMKRIVIGIAAIASLLTTGASAADLAPRMYTKAPTPVAVVYDWTGFYIGGNVGYPSM
jgi:hypothetical protein